MLFWDEIRRNKRNSMLLMIFFLIFTLTFVFSIGVYISILYNAVLGSIITLAGTIYAIFYALNAYKNGDQIILKSVGAIPLDEYNLPPDKKEFIKDTVESLSIAGGIPTPKIYIMKADMINAFATGKDPEHASVCITSGAIEKLSREEIEGVLGHEIGHILNNDIRYLTLASILLAIIITFVWFSFRISLISEKERMGYIIIAGLALAAIAAVFGKLIQLAISRKREFLADATSVKLTRYPNGLISALEKIKMENKKLEAPHKTALLWIWEPHSLLSTHPPIDERIKRLKAML